MLIMWGRDRILSWSVTSTYGDTDDEKHEMRIIVGRKLRILSYLSWIDC